MGGNVSCFYPAEEEYECPNACSLHPLPLSPNNSAAVGRNTNSHVVIGDEHEVNKMISIDGDGGNSPMAHMYDVGSSLSKAHPSQVSPCNSVGRVSNPLANLAHYRAEMLGFSVNAENECLRYTMFVRGVNNSFAQVERILSQRLLHGLQRRYGCRMVQDMETALYRGNEVRLITIDGPSKSQICKFRSALPTSLTRYLITGVNLSADVDDVLET